MNATADRHQEYVKACGLAVDATSASRAARAAWRKLAKLENKASKLFAEAWGAYAAMGDTTTAGGLKKASGKHWNAQYVAVAGFQKVYEGLEIRNVVAGAPELLEACRAMLASSGLIGNREDVQRAVQLMRAAVAKAEGRDELTPE